MLIHPLGNPASWASTARARQLKGVSPAGFHTVVHPAAKAAPHFRVIIAIGKFQGAMHAATPRGCLKVKILCLELDEGTTSPQGLSVLMAKNKGKVGGVF
ncbi:unnamed protein product [Clonostachys rosea]|uniref:Uncharacterized protein n=1 Tax=Bionectria ochroleuca TaxID=29856 RepID=A0ABY6TS45_BIOOC|nr:unnamed protein product [Clonostachys rosea]